MSIGIIRKETKPEVLKEKKFENYEFFFAFVALLVHYVSNAGKKTQSFVFG